jgi:hypothetical protein
VPAAPSEPVRYLSADEDSGRWTGFPFRAGDIVISTRSKSGTTWMQMICALLVFGTPDLPEPLDRLSPWLDWLVAPREDVYAQLEAQRHRRFVKTHTPLDGIPIDPRATYIVVGRHPLDMAVSLYHQRNNTDRDRLRALTGQPEPAAPEPPFPPLHEWLDRWIGFDGDRLADMDSLPGVMWHLSDAWARVQAGAPNVVLVHYDDLLSDRATEMRRIAQRLGFVVDEARWPELVRAAGFDEMRAHALYLAPAANGVLRDRTAFFRRGVSGSGRESLTPADLARYQERAVQLAPPDLLQWLHRDTSHG